MQAETYKKVRAKLVDLGKCPNCSFGVYNHGSGAGKVERCFLEPLDNKNPHKYCPCETCQGTGTKQEITKLLALLDKEQSEHA